MVYFTQMVERLGDQHHEGAQTQQPLDSAIARFFVGFNNPNTKAAYRKDLQVFSDFARRTDVSQLDQLTVEFIDNYLKHCGEDGISRETIRRRTAPLIGLLKHEGMEGLARKTRDISNKHIGVTQEMQLLHPLSNEEVKRLQEVSQNNSRDSAIIAIALGIGANATEILDLHAEDIVEVDGQVSVQFGGKRGRIAKLNPDASAIVERHRGGRREDVPLFTKEQLGEREAKPLTRGGLWTVLKGYGERIGRPDLNPRVLRETFIANVQTNDSKELAKLLNMHKHTSRGLLERRRLTRQLPQSAVLFEAITTK